MEELVRKEQELQAASPKAHPAIDISYVELPTKLTSRIDLSGILGAIAFLAMLAAPGAVEGGMYITAAVLVATSAACACLSIKENGKKR